VPENSGIIASERTRAWVDAWRGARQKRLGTAIAGAGEPATDVSSRRPRRCRCRADAGLAVSGATPETSALSPIIRDKVRCFHPPILRRKNLTFFLQRSVSLKRQLIFVTHQCEHSCPRDADCVVVMEMDGPRSARPCDRGVDAMRIRSPAAGRCKEAFKSRQEKYGLAAA